MAETANNGTKDTSLQNENLSKLKVTKIWKYRIIIFLLILLIIGLVGGFGYIGYTGYRTIEDKRREVEELKSELSELREERNISVVDLKDQIGNLNKIISDLEDQNSKLSAELEVARNKIKELTPKNIKDLDYKALIKTNPQAGDVWLNPIYVDVNGDNKLDGIFAYRMGGAGGFLNVYVFTYLDNTLTEILRAEEYLKGTVSYLTDQNVVEIRSQSGTPDSPTVAVTRFKWDPSTKKLVKVEN